MLLDINHARIVHLEWELKLEEILRGGRKPVKVSTHQECILGAWLYTEGMSTYKNMSEIIRLEELHSRFHTVAQRVINEHARRNDEKAQELFVEVSFLSKEIIFLLTLIELKIINRKKKTDIIFHPVRSVSRLFKD